MSMNAAAALELSLPDERQILLIRQERDRIHIEVQEEDQSSTVPVLRTVFSMSVSERSFLRTLKYGGLWLPLPEDDL